MVGESRPSDLQTVAWSHTLVVFGTLKMGERA